MRRAMFDPCLENETFHHPWDHSAIANLIHKGFPINRSFMASFVMIRIGIDGVLIILRGILVDSCLKMFLHLVMRYLCMHTDWQCNLGSKILMHENYPAQLTRSKHTENAKGYIG